MNQALTVISVAILLTTLVLGTFGLWNFVNSNAAENGFNKVVDAFTEGLSRICVGIFILLASVAAGILMCTFGRMVEQAAMPAAQAYRTIAETEQRKQLPSSTLATPYLLEDEAADCLGFTGE